ncbi:MAG: sugar ABC transporter substrate-binding protein [Ruthenibacterium sp.]
MKRRSSKLVAIVLTLALTLSFAACGGSAPAAGESKAPAEAAPSAATGEKIELKFLHKWPQPENMLYFDEVAAAYMKENPNVTIISEGVGDEPIKDKLRVMMGSDDRPDVFFSWSGEFAKKFIAAGAALDLTDAMKANDGAWEKSIMQAGLEPFSSGGKIYGVPLRINGKFFAYNKEIFDKLGLKEPANWDEFLKACDTIKQNGIVPIAFGDQYPWAACHYITGLNQKMVPQDVRVKDYEKTTGEFTDPGYVEALDKFKELNDKGYFNASPNSTSHDMANQSFAMGECAMIYVELEEFSSLDTNMEGTPWGFFAMPTIEGAAGNQKFLVGAPDGFMVSSTSKHPEEAVKFLQYLVNPENAGKLVEMLKWPSPVIGAINADNSPEYLVSGMKAVESAEGMALWLDTDIDIRVSDVYLPGLQDLLNGDITSADLMTKVQEIAKTVQTAP